VINSAEIEEQLARFLGPTRAGRLLDPPVSGARVKDLVRAGKLDAIKTDLGLLIDPGSIERLQQERTELAEAG
jgi:hypothetical protein